jgi:hypothetical protein
MRLSCAEKWIAAAIPFVGVIAAWLATGYYVSSFDTLHLSIAPTSGSGRSQVFHFQAQSSHGAEAVCQISVSFGSLASGQHRCYLKFGMPADLWLRDDGGRFWSLGHFGVPWGTPPAIANSQCSVDMAVSRVAVVSRKVLEIDLAVQFQAGYEDGEPMPISAMAYDGETKTEWLPLGVWTVPR